MHLVLKDSEAQELKHDSFNLGVLVTALNKDHDIILANPAEHRTVESIEYFIRSSENNLVVADSNTDISVFSFDDRAFKNYSGANINDLVLLLGRDVLRYVFDAPLEVIGHNSVPTPYGVRKATEDGNSLVLAFQLIVNAEGLKKMHNDFRYKVLTPETQIEGEAKLIHKQFKYTNK